MVILHIASISDYSFSGVNVVVPQHIHAQSEYVTCGFYNIRNIKIDTIDNQLCYQDYMEIEKLPQPFNYPDLVVFHEVYYAKYIKIALQLRRKKIPYVIIPHSQLTIEAQNHKKLKKTIANLCLFRAFVQGAIAVQCLSKSEMDSSKMARKKFVSTNGILMPTVKKTNFRCEGKRLVYIGRLEAYQKGLDILIDAAASSLDYLSEADSKILLYGPDLNGRFDEINKMIQDKKVSNIVDLYHEVSGKEKEEKLLDADIFIQTSRFEGMPMGVLEALSYGIPCLITEGTTLGSIVSRYNAGWVCQTDPESVAKTIKEALDMPESEYKEKSDNALRLVKEQFEWSNIAEKAISIYKELLNF